MINTEREADLMYTAVEENLIIQEYGQIVENLQQNLNACKTEQNNIRSQVETLRQEGKLFNDVIRDYFSRAHYEECINNNLPEKEMISNLQERMLIIQMEKDSVYQLWQTALKAAKVLEEELRVYKADDKDIRLYEEQINSIKATYSEAIKILEEKLTQAKENFVKQQALLESSKIKIDDLKREKEGMAKNLLALQKESTEKDKNHQQKIDCLISELASAKAEAERQASLKSVLETQLSETKRLNSNLIAKNEETNYKMAEAIELVESAVREKDIALQKEAQVREEKEKVELKLAAMTERFSTIVQEEGNKSKDIHERSIKKYLLEIKELKTELRQAVTLLDRSQRECRLVEEELTKFRQTSEDSLHRYSLKIIDLEEKLKATELRLQDADNFFRKKYESEKKELEEKISQLQKQLDISKDKIIKLQLDNSNNVANNVKNLDEKAKEVVERYNSLERRLAKTVNDKETLIIELRSLQETFNREIEKRNREKYVLENKILELEINLQMAKSLAENTAFGNLPAGQLNQLIQETKSKYNIDAMAKELHELQEKCDKRVKELSHHVEIHQELSKKWKEEAKSLATKFQAKCKEFRCKINSLRKQNDKLQEELLICKQQLAQHGIQIVHVSNQRDENR